MLDVFRLRQYFDVLTRLRDVVRGVDDDIALGDDIRRTLLPLPTDRRPDPAQVVFPAGPGMDALTLHDRRVALLATGGSGALASVVGAARALEELGIRPAVISVCSGSALFGFPIAAGIPAADVAAFVLSLRSHDYVDVDWRRLALLGPTAARGFAGILHGDRLEARYRELLGDRTLGDLPIPVYAPIWNIEENRVEYLGTRTHPELSVAHAVRMAVSLPLFIEPVALDGAHWCDGGIVDIFPVEPLLSLEPHCDLVLAINGFYPPGFLGEDATGWEDEPLSILSIASQVRTCQQVELARVNLARLRATTTVTMIEPVPYEKVRGLGFYHQFLDNRDWPEFMRSGRRAGLEALRGVSRVTLLHGTASSAAPRSRSASRAPRRSAT